VATAEPIVYIVEDEPAVREALVALLRSVRLRTQAFASAEEFLREARPDTPACLVLDVHLPGLDGLGLQLELARRGDEIPIIFITGYGDIPTSVRAIKAGAVEFLSKPFGDQSLLEATSDALARDAQRRAQGGELADTRRCYASLTPREREVMALVIRGRLNKQIAAQLGLSEITVKVHRRHVMIKMNAASLAQLVRMGDSLA
jgi:FixJ family two-component response regulator